MRDPPARSMTISAKVRIRPSNVSTPMMISITPHGGTDLKTVFSTGARCFHKTLECGACVLSEPAADSFSFVVSLQKMRFATAGA